MNTELVINLKQLDLDIIDTITAKIKGDELTKYVKSSDVFTIKMFVILLWAKLGFSVAGS